MGIGYAAFRDSLHLFKNQPWRFLMTKKSSNRTNNTPWLKWILIGGLGVILLAVAAGLLLNRPGDTASTTEPPPAEVSVDDAYELYNEGTFLLDVRTQEEWNEYHIPETTHIPLDQLPARLAEVPTDQTIVVVCRSGNRSQQGRDILKQAGYGQVTSMTGGLKTWQAKGYPVTTGP
jgi:rhodanese-related sulfurtransferase